MFELIDPRTLMLGEEDVKEFQEMIAYFEKYKKLPPGVRF